LQANMVNSALKPRRCIK